MRIAEAREESWRVRAEAAQAEVERLKQEWAADRQDRQDAYSGVRAKVERLRAALLKIEEIASRPSLSNEERMSAVWQLTVMALAEDKGSYEDQQ
jgi:hypothetical protein